EHAAEFMRSVLSLGTRVSSVHLPLPHLSPPPLSPPLPPPLSPPLAPPPPHPLPFPIPFPLPQLPLLFPPSILSPPPSTVPSSFLPWSVFFLLTPLPPLSPLPPLPPLPPLLSFPPFPNPIFPVAAASSSPSTPPPCPSFPPGHCGFFSVRCASKHHKPFPLLPSLVPLFLTPSSFPLFPLFLSRLPAFPVSPFPLGPTLSCADREPLRVPASDQRCAATGNLSTNRNSSWGRFVRGVTTLKHTRRASGAVESQVRLRFSRMPRGIAGAIRFSRTPRVLLRGTHKFFHVI
ncbi:unnamed protein product, partial [Closterium sp. NIES-53]